MVGRDLISAAEIRSQISQIEGYRTAVNTFRGKYNFLPGDVPEADATNFGLTVRDSSLASEAGNGIVEYDSYGGRPAAYEPVAFWCDLTAAHLIAENFTAGYVFAPNTTSSTQIIQYWPQAKLGQSSYVYVLAPFGQNYFTVASAVRINLGQPNGFNAGGYAAMKVSQAYAIDTKIDDGKAGGGTVRPFSYIYDAFQYLMYPTGTGAMVGGPFGSMNIGTGSYPGSSSSCVDNGGVAGVAWDYSMTQNGGNGLNCALSFKFQ